MPAPEIATTYLAARQRIDDLVRPLDEGALALPVAACPGWSVRDVVCHLAGTVIWAAEGRLRGVPSDEDTAAQVAELADAHLVEVLDRWAAMAPMFAEAVAERSIWPAAIDAVTHEHDIRQALGRPGARDTEDVRRLADLVLASWSPARPVEVVRGDRTVRVGPAEGDPIRWRTDDFEVLRVRLGRRSRSQMAALDWSADPGALLDDLVVFGPAEADVDEPSGVS
jgi:uncharacterized protein (TIGR03083 family)